MRWLGLIWLRRCGAKHVTGISSQEALAEKAGVHRTYVGRLERGETGVTVEALAAILAPMSVTLGEFFAPFEVVVRLRSPRQRG